MLLVFTPGAFLLTVRSAMAHKRMLAADAHEKCASAAIELVFKQRKNASVINILYTYCM